MNILYLTTVLPNRMTGGEIASEAFINALIAHGFEVTVLGYRRSLSDKIHNGYFHSAGVRPIETSASRIHALSWMVQAFVNNVPYSVQKFQSAGYVSCLHTLLKQKDIGLVVLDHAQMAWVRRHIPAAYPVILVAHNVENEIYRDHAGESTAVLRRFIYTREAKLMREQETQLALSVKQVWTLSKHDYDYFTHIAGSGARLFGVPSLESGRPEGNENISKTYDVGIIGTWTWEANNKGLLWFFEMVYPLLADDISIKVAGKGADWIIGKYPNVEYCGFVPSAGEFMAAAKVIAIPSISGGGIQIKTLDAISSGACIMATPVALRGIPTYPETVKVAEGAGPFAEGLQELVQNPMANTGKIAKDWIATRDNRFKQDIVSAMSCLCKADIQ